MPRKLALVIIILLPSISSAALAYDPPIGIPPPSFGIDESHAMYSDATYDFGAGPAAYPDAGNGPFTHYVDNTHPNATNEDNPFGSPARPRRDIFDGLSRTLKAGSVVEIHGGPYNYTGWRRIVSEGTAAKPVFVRGVAPGQRVRTQAGPEERHDLRLEGSYLIVENLEMYDGAFFRVWSESHHIAVRACEVHNPPDRWINTGTALSIGSSCRDIVAYGNHIHHNRRLGEPPDTPQDLHGTGMGAGAQRIWILGNHIHHNSGDAFQASHRAIPAPRFVYVGGNEMHHDRENGVDLKSIEDVVVSQNTIYGYQASETSSGDAIVVGSNGFDPDAPYGPKRSWIIFNDIRDSRTGIRVEGAVDCWILGNTIHDLDGNGITLDIDPDSDNVNIVDNTIVRAGGDGIHHSWQTGATDISIEGNIISDVSGDHVEMDEGLISEVTMRSCLFDGSGAAIEVRWGRDRLTAQSAAEINELRGCGGNAVGDPGFVDAANADFRIRAPSAAIDKGAKSSAYADFQRLHSIDITLDHAGAPRPQGPAWDIGAFEARRPVP